MSLLIKALDKAQEQAQAAKGKKESQKTSIEHNVDPDVSTKKMSKEKKAPGMRKTQQDISEELSSQALSFEDTRPNIDLVFAESVDSASTYLDKEVSLSLQDDSKDEKPAIAPAISGESKSAINESKISAASAANVFSAKRVEATNQNAKLAFLAGTALVVLFAIGGYFYWQLNAQPTSLMPAPELQVTKTPPEVPVDQSNSTAEKVGVSENIQITEKNNSDANASANVMDEATTAPTPNNAKAEHAGATQMTDPFAPDDEKQKTVRLEQALSKNKKSPAMLERVLVDDEMDTSANKQSSPKAQPRQSKVIQMQNIASDSATIQVTKNLTQPEINPTVMRAYEAYNAGKDSEAQQLYKQVLQRDGRNVDALLGLGAIASRQDRTADANGWYGKVLELEPRNAIAQAALISRSDGIGDYQQVDLESRMKTMLAKQPDDPNLHAALGQYYADKNQWINAQQAYFDAYRLNPSADNAFNLAVCLDQMRKPKLALPYYQRALEQSDSASNIDKDALQARISAIQ